MVKTKRSARLILGFTPIVILIIWLLVSLAAKPMMFGHYCLTSIKPPPPAVFAAAKKFGGGDSRMRRHIAAIEAGVALFYMGVVGIVLGYSIGFPLIAKSKTLK